MGLFTLCLGGGAFFLIGAWEALSSSYAHLHPSLSYTSQPSRKHGNSFFSSFTLFAIALFSFLSILNSIFSSVDALQHNDRVGFALQLQYSATSFLFLIYSLTGFLIDFTQLLPLPPSILNLIALFAFGQEFLLFYLQRKDPYGLENRYFDLLLVPIFICFFSTLLQMGLPKSPFPTLARGIGLILQGTWFIQMGFSFYTSLIAHGCTLHEKSRGNYTIRCKGHPESHRSKAITTLQFNCHLAFLVVLVISAYSVMGQGHRPTSDYRSYKPLSEELRQFDNPSQFTLNSDDDEEEITLEEKAIQQKPPLQVLGANGFGAH
ncbi:uncharacterized protein LOC131258309 [Magnolia sinica]|uniref:uncharacterized protein LOC131258309 n=1 Tax=Magnolia sinica TaxID=86752 RepID=UPI002659E6D8|nr:uncharacterized protein LOC131258309 [Magnolia sinica]XP_058115523.1 uncharacterized protein LOC131258309 [Magnolia sinica]XP_058115525.1 uncharacterized protein LOC131258309 [Magnolia sinica]